MNQYSLIAVAEDLEYLSQWGMDISNGEIRRGVATLRRLLIEDAYGAAWRAVGGVKQPSLPAVDLSLLVGDDVNKVSYALAAGANFRGIRIASSIVSKGKNAIDWTPPEIIREDGYPFERMFTLSKYLSSSSGIIDGRSFNRGELIKYLAYIKGGVHLNTKSKKHEEKLIARVGKIEKKIMVHNTDGLLVEAVACAQSLGNSKDAKYFIKKVRSILHS